MTKKRNEDDRILLLSHEQSAIDYLQECIAIWRDRRTAAKTQKLRRECNWQMGRYQNVIDQLLKR